MYTHVINGDPSSLASSSVVSANSLFDKRVPICLRGVGYTGEKVEELPVRILLCADQEGQNRVSQITPTT